ncbi:hypothetical protein BC628DRAFT_1388984 [Trametes gibbosa]|nr:hypothetical protein BC628DRAFT_1388984 [Trametes gibbosa]
MFTTLITLFLSIFGALRASPLYSGILTLGNGFTGRGSGFNCASVLPLLDSEAAIIAGKLLGNGTPARIFHWPLSLPSPPVLLTLSAGTLGRPDAYHDLISVLTLAALVGLTILVPIKAILSLRAWVLAAPSVDTIDHVAAVIYVSGSPYEGDVFSAWNDLAGVLDASMSSAMSSIYTPTAAPSSYVPTPHIPSGKKAKRPRTISRAPPLQPAVIAQPAPAAPPWNMAIATEVEPSSVHADDDNTGWQTWTTQRRRRPPRHLPPPASSLSSSSSRSSSVCSTPSTSASLFSYGSLASTAPTTAPSSRRSSFRTSSSSSSETTTSLLILSLYLSRTRTLYAPDKTFYNMFMVLEVFSAEE